MEEVEKEVEIAAKKHEAFLNCINAEIKARKTLLTALDQADRFYRNQRRDVKKVVYVSSFKSLNLKDRHLKFFELKFKNFKS